jgi:soluble lytic murein transglycosylase-like protein
MPEKLSVAIKLSEKIKSCATGAVLHSTAVTLLLSCTHTGSDGKSQSSRHINDPRNQRPSDTLQPHEQNPYITKLIRLLPETNQSIDSFSNTPTGQKLRQMIGRQPTPQDTQALIALRALLIAQREIREQRPTQARELAKFILSTEHLSTHIYSTALKYLALSDVLLLTSRDLSTGEDGTARDPRVEFNALQSLQCAAVCQSHGWQIISQEDPTLLSTQGYRTRLLSESSFRSERLQQPLWLKSMFLNSMPSTKIARSEETEEEQNTSKNFEKSRGQRLRRVLKLRQLIDSRKWSQASDYAKNIVSERSDKLSRLKSENTCRADIIYGHYAIAQAARIGQDRRSFSRQQDIFVSQLEHSSCVADDFGFDKEQFDSFKLDSRLWLARLSWEQDNNPVAFSTARRVLDEAIGTQSWEHFADAVKVLIGRVGFEMLNPQENLSFLSAIEKNYPAQEKDDDFPIWIESRRGLFQFLSGDFEAARQTFGRIIDLTTDASTRSMAFYWIGRTQIALKNQSEGENSFLSAGMTDPLGIYDVLSGQMLGRESGRASTHSKRAFDADWKAEQHDWLNLNETRQLRIISSVPPRTLVAMRSDESIKLTLASQKQFDVSLESTFLFLTLLRAVLDDLNHEDFAQFIKDSDDLIPTLLRQETQQLRQSFQQLNTLHSEVLPRAHQIAWLTYSLGDYSNAILFVGRLREALGWDTDYLPFLYFIFYPRPYANEFEKAAKRCSVDVDLLYAVARQESLFQASVKSPVGATGLMQLLPTTARRILREFPEFSDEQAIDLTVPATNILAGACYLKKLLVRYDNNPTFAIAAYNAGEAAVDRWVTRRQKLKDAPFFIEFIPFAETKTYVQRVLRNFYNFKWIYRNQNSD